MNEKQFEECLKGFKEWTKKEEVELEDVELFSGWLACYSWLLKGKKKEFDIMLDEMYNSYKQEDFGGKDE